MADKYVRTEWVNGKIPAIDADHLNNIENGIEEALSGLVYLGEDIISSPADDTSTKWTALGTGYAYFKTKNLLTDQPSTWGIVVSIVKHSDVFQLWCSIGANVLICKRSGNYNGWFSSWVKSLDENSGVSKSGDVMTGSLGITRTDEVRTAVDVANSNGDIGLVVSQNRGLYDNANNKWVVQSLKNSEDWIFNGKATGLTSATALTNLGGARIEELPYVGTYDINDASTRSFTLNFKSKPKIVFLGSGGDYVVILVQGVSRSITVAGSYTLNTSWSENSVTVSYGNAGGVYESLNKKGGSYVAYAIY